MKSPNLTIAGVLFLCLLCGSLKLNEMKITVAELRKSMAAAMIGKTNETTKQHLSAVYEEINLISAEIVENCTEAGIMAERAGFKTKLNLTAQAQEQLAEDGFTIEPLEYGRDEESPDLYRISWSY